MRIYNIGYVTALYVIFISMSIRTITANIIEQALKLARREVLLTDTPDVSKIDKVEFMSLHFEYTNLEK